MRLETAAGIGPPTAVRLETAAGIGTRLGGVVRRFGPFVVLVALAAVFLGDTLTGSRVFALRDVIFDAVPWRRFAPDGLARGDAPLWNPSSRFGQPCVANPQSAVFYPPHLLFPLVPAATFVSLNILLHLVIAAGGTYALCRRLDLGAGGALVAAATYAFGSYMTVNLEFMSVMEVLAWAPATLFAAHRAADPGRTLAGRCRDVALLALIVALQILPGNPQPVTYTLLLAGGLVVARGLGEGRPRELPSVVVVLVVGVVLAAALCAIQLLPTWELVPHSSRAAGVDPGLDIASMHPRHLLSAVLPFVHGRPGGDMGPSGVFEFWLGSFHVGWPALLLAVCAFLPVGTAVLPRWALLWAGAALVLGFVLAFGRHTPVYPFLLDTVPGFDLLRWPAKALQLVATALAILAGAGAARLLSIDALRARGTVVAALLVAAVFGNLWWHARRIHGTIPGDVLQHRPAGVDAFPGAPHERAWIDPVHTAAAYAVYGSRDANEILAAIDVIAGETALPYGLHKTWGGDALHVASAKSLTDVLDDPLASDAAVERAATLASIRWAWTGAPPRWVERPRAFPRAFVATADSTLDDARPETDLGPPIVEGDRLRILGPIPAGRLVVVTDTYLPDWTAQADHAHIRPVEVNGAFLGVPIEPGPEDVRQLVLTYDPASFARGWKVSLIGLLVLAQLLVISSGARTRRA